MASYLVTGGAGFIGSHTCDRLLALGHEVIVLDALTPPVHRGGKPANTSTGADFYQGDPANLYAKAIHQNMVDGKAYAFAFDDVLNQESLVHDGDPRLASITMTPF